MGPRWLVLTNMERRANVSCVLRFTPATPFGPQQEQVGRSCATGQCAINWGRAIRHDGLTEISNLLFEMIGVSVRIGDGNILTQITLGFFQHRRRREVIGIFTLCHHLYGADGGDVAAIRHKMDLVDLVASCQF